MLWVFAALLVVAAVLFAVAPLLRRRPGAVLDPVQASSRVNEALLRETSRELTDGLEAPEAQALLDELGARYLDEAPVATETAQAASTAEPTRWGLAVLTVAVPLVALSVYLAIGEPDAPRLSSFERVISEELSEGELDGLVVAMRERVLQRPEDAKTWYLLGHTLMRQQRYAEAVRAFGSAHGAAGPDPNIEIYWLQASYLAGQGALDEAGQRLLTQVASRQPNNPLVLEIQALEKFRSGELKAAVGYLERAIAGLGASERALALMQALEGARARLGELGEDAAEGAGPYIEVEVRASQAPPPGSTLFVVARPVGGGMPYAVVRRPATFLPLTVRLDDAVSMSPANPLSKAAEVEVVARISLTGTATATPTDWRWQSAPIDVAAAPALEALLTPPG